jgi:hypothetical protein
VPKKAYFSAQNVLDHFLSLHTYLFVPKVLLAYDQKMLNLRRMKMFKEGLPTSVISFYYFMLTFTSKQA